MKKIKVPVYTTSTATLALTLEVEPDAEGEVWLTPQQTDQLEVARAHARVWAEKSIHGTSRPRRRTKGSTYYTPPTVDSAVMAPLQFDGCGVLGTLQAVTQTGRWVLS